MKQYEKRSLLLAEEIETNSRLFGGRAILISRQRFFYQGNNIYEENGKFTCLVGYIVSDSFRNDRNTIVEQIHGILLTNPNRSWLDKCLGEYQIIHYNGKTLEFICAPAMTHPLYYRKDEEEIAISNRASLTNLSINNHKPSLDPKTQVEIIAFDSIINSRTAFKNTLCLERGNDIIVRYNYSTPNMEKIRRDKLWAEENKTSTLIDALEELKPIYRWFIEHLSLLDKQVKIDNNMEFHLSGGKDSRLLLASFEVSGLMNRFNHVLTYGESGDPEVEAAKLVTKHYRIKHHIQPRGINSSNFFERLPHHIFQLEGEINCRVLQGNYQEYRKTHFTGHEVGLRESFIGTENIITYEHAKKFISQSLPFDPIGIINKNFIKEIQLDTIELLHEAKKWNVKPENFLNFLSIIGRGARWVGKITSMSSSIGLYANVFCSTPIIQYAHNLGILNRKREMVHFGMLKYLDKEIFKYPFANQDWHTDIKNHFSNQYDLPLGCIGVDGQLIKKIDNWWDILYKMNDHQYIKRIIWSLKHAQLDDYIDYNLLFYYIDAAKKPSMRAMLSIYAVISANLIFQAQDITLDSVDNMKTILAEVEKECNSSLFFSNALFKQSESYHRIKIPLKNEIYRKIFKDDSKGNNKVHLREIKINNENIQGIFIHSNNECCVNLDDEKTYEMTFRCIILQEVINKCEEQVFKIFENNKNNKQQIFSYVSRKGEREWLPNIQFKIKITGTVIFAVNSPISSNYGWCMIIVDELREI